MKKTLVFFLVILTVISSVFVYATGDVSSDKLSDASALSITSVESGNVQAASAVTTAAVSPSSPLPPAATITQSPTRTLAPSIEPPMIFTVSTVDGATSLVLSEVVNSAVELIFNISPKGQGFSESFTIKKIVNTSNNYTYDYNQNIAKDSKGWNNKTDVTFTGTDAGKAITFELHWVDFSGATRIEKAQIKIDDPAPQLSITTALGGPIVPGAPVEIKYTIKNTGKVTLKNVLLSDATVSSLNNGETFTSDEFLAPDGIIEKSAYIVVDGQVTLSPSVSFTYRGSTQTIKGEEMTLSAQEVIPTISLTCDNYVVAQKGSVQKFKYTIKNTTQVPLTNISVYDSDTDDARLVNTIQTLDVGESYDGTYDLTVTKSGYYKFKIHYSYQGADMDKQQFAKTDKAIKLPNEVFFDIISTTPETLSTPDEMIFTVLVENDTIDELRDITISEDNNLFERIELKNTVVPASSGGETGKFQYDVKVNIPAGTTHVQFSLSYTINGELSILNATKDIKFTDVGTNTSPTPTATDSQSGTEPGDDNKKSTMFIWICICIIILILIITLIVILFIVKGKQNTATAPASVRRKMANAFDEDLDQYEDYDEYTNDSSEDTFKYDSENAEFIEPLEILETDNLDEEFSEEFDDDYDDEGVKIYKSKK